MADNGVSSRSVQRISEEVSVKVLGEFYERHAPVTTLGVQREILLRTGFPIDRDALEETAYLTLQKILEYHNG